MPLRAVLNNQNIFSFEFNEITWANLKAIYKTKQLQMACCKTIAIPKKSKLGNYFFAHSSNTECTSLPESSEHIYVKTLIAMAAKEAGWAVTTEYNGQSPNGEKWTADVLCEKRKVRLALEVQCSPQTKDNTEYRQLRYKNSGVRCCWFLSEKTFKNFNLCPSDAIPFFIFSAFEMGNEPKIKDFDIGIKAFVKALLGGQIKWVEEEVVETISILYIKDKCWNEDCQKEVKQVYGYAIDVYGDEAKTVPNASNILEYIHSFISNDELKSLGLNSIKACNNLKGNAPNYPYCNICSHCNLPQSNFYLMKKLANTSQSSESIEYADYEIKVKSIGKWKYKINI